MNGADSSNFDDVIIGSGQAAPLLAVEFTLTLPRTDITNLLREVSGEDETRLKKVMLADLEIALLEQGLRCYPSLTATTTGDTVRLFHAGKLLGKLVDVLIHPDQASDKELGRYLWKIKDAPQMPDVDA